MPGFYALVDGPTGQEQSDDRVKPAPPKRCRRAQPEQDGPGLGGAQVVLNPFSDGGTRVQALAQPLLGPPEQRHHDQAGGGDSRPRTSSYSRSNAAGGT